MERNELRELKRELLKEIDVLIREHKSFKRRISVIANLFIPGLGFVIYGSSYLKGFVSFALFVLYNLFYFKMISPHLGETAIYIILYSGNYYLVCEFCNGGNAG